MATEFQQQVWNALQKIPRGQVTTYVDIARYLGKPRASRAVGSACGANPQLVSLPCHRVVGSCGRLGQYARGVHAKEDILISEGLSIRQGRVLDFEARHYRFSD